MALAGLIAPIWFTLLVIVQGFQDGYSHVAMPISALTAWPAGWVQRFNFCVTGILMVVFAVGLHRRVAPSRFGAVGFALLALGGIGIVFAGIFPWVLVNGVPSETPAHVAAAITSFGSTSLGLMVFSRRLATDDRWSDLAPYTLFTGATMAVLFVALGRFAIDDGTPLHPWAGLLQRVICAIWFTCVLVLASRFRRLEQGDRVRADPATPSV